MPWGSATPDRKGGRVISDANSEIAKPIKPGRQPIREPGPKVIVDNKGIPIVEKK